MGGFGLYGGGPAHSEQQEKYRASRRNHPPSSGRVPLRGGRLALHGARPAHDADTADIARGVASARLDIGAIDDLMGGKQL